MTDPITESGPSGLRGRSARPCPADRGRGASRARSGSRRAGHGRSEGPGCPPAASRGSAAPSIRAHVEAAARLERALAWQEFGLKLRRIAAVVTLIGFGWFAHGQVGPRDHRQRGLAQAARLRRGCPALARDRRFCAPAWSRSPRVEAYDPAEILAETGIRLPALPEDWQVRDAQVFPSRHGHSIEIAIDAGDLGRVSLFAAQAPAFDVIAPTLARFDKANGRVLADRPTRLRADRHRQRQSLERAALRLSRKLP